MGKEDDRFMRILVFFDLPVKKKVDRKFATQFRNFLLKDGFYMIQYSVYGRICKGADAVEKHMSRIKCKVPPSGSIRLMQVTDSQYSRMETLIGDVKNEEKLSNDQLLLF